MLDQSTLRGRIIAATLKLAAERPWRDVTLLDIAEATSVSLVDIRHEFASKSDILAAFTRAVDDEVLRRAPKRDQSLGARDSIFEILMSRFDVLGPYKEAVRSIAGAGPTLDPAFACAAFASQHWMLQAAGVDTSGVTGKAKVGALAGLYASVLHTWLDDEDPGLARTMAALDRRLRRGERTLTNIEDMKAGVSRFASALGSFVSRRSRPAKKGDAAASGPRPEEYPSAGI
jgi:ubiquinone biosynthesis protein COQ9